MRNVPVSLQVNVFPIKRDIEIVLLPSLKLAIQLVSTPISMRQLETIRDVS